LSEIKAVDVKEIECGELLVVDGQGDEEWIRDEKNN